MARSRMTPRMVNSSRSLVSSSLRSSAAARGGGGMSAPVMMIAGTEAGSRASSAAPSRPGIRMSARTRSTGFSATMASAWPPSAASRRRSAMPVEQAAQHLPEGGVVVG